MLFFLLTHQLYGIPLCLIDLSNVMFCLLTAGSLQLCEVLLEGLDRNNPMVHFDRHNSMSLTDLTLFLTNLGFLLTKSLTSQMSDFITAILLCTFITDFDDLWLLLLHLYLLLSHSDIIERASISKKLYPRLTVISFCCLTTNHQLFCCRKLSTLLGFPSF